MLDLIERSHYDDLTGKMVQTVTYDNSAVIEANKRDQNDAPTWNRYKGNLAHVGRIHMGDIARLKNKGYDLLSSDKDEVKRALLYIQSEERHLLTVPGTPFAKVSAKWV